MLMMAYKTVFLGTRKAVGEMVGIENYIPCNKIGEMNGIEYYIPWEKIDIW